ncbi:MAG: hydroxymethylglutaryl-CoA synthase [Bacteroidota bacterium]
MMPNVGICDMALYVPKLYLSIEELANARDLEYAKLNKGLGLEQMRLPDIHEDAATMAANAIFELIEKNQLNPTEIGRIYLGTESALDGAKPTATYVLEMLRQKYADTYGEDCFRNCDVVDLVFACVGAIDALHNTLDWVRGRENRKAIVVASDYAKYELASGGEYTQGAGAVAMLVKQNPRLIVIDDVVGVATQGVHDFFKPRRTISKRELLQEVSELVGDPNYRVDDLMAKLPAKMTGEGVLNSNDEIVEIFKETPVFDGQYSNLMYQNRIREAYEDFCAQQGDINGAEDNFIASWDRLVFHLPYAFHAKRIASELFMMSKKKDGSWAAFSENVLEEPKTEDYEDQDTYEGAKGKFLRSITKTPEYQEFAKEKLEKAEKASSLVGNMYAASIFLAMMSTLEKDLEEGNELKDGTLGFVGYGSGSKSKVFHGKLQDTWREVVTEFKVFDKLKRGTEIDYATYEKLHRKQINESINTPAEEFALVSISSEVNKTGARYYQWKQDKAVLVG